LRFFDAILASTDLWDQVKTTIQVEQAARPDFENREPPGALQGFGKLGVIVIEKRSVARDESGFSAGWRGNRRTSFRRAAHGTTAKKRL